MGIFIKSLLCSCAIGILLTVRIAGVQYRVYRTYWLLLCKHNFIEIFFCSCATVQLDS